MALSRLHPSLWGRCLAVPLLFSVVLACNQKAQEGHGLLPPAPADQTTSANSSPAPFDQPLGKAAFARTVLHTAGPANIDVTVRDAIVGPHGEVELPDSGGPVIVDLLSGKGSAAAGGKMLDLSSQQPASFPAGAAVTLKNSGDSPLVVRLYMLEGK
jgi:hypothetical protein